MATQVIEFDLGSLPPVTRLRDDVSAVLLFVTEAGRPRHLSYVPRPASGTLSAAEVRNAVAADPIGADIAADHAIGTAVSERPVSVVIPTRERPEDLARCLRSLSNAWERGHEVIVVDSGPTTDRTAAVAREFGVRYVREALPGANRARNAGVAAARHDVIAFVDDDVSVSADWIGAIGATFADPAVACMTGLVLPLELETEAQEDFERYSSNRRDLRRRTYAPGSVPASAAGVVGIGANMALRRDVLVKLGGFDARFGPGMRTRTGDETDLFARLIDAGGLIVYNPGAYVWHRHRRTAQEVRSCVFGYGVGLYSMLTKRVLEQRDSGAFIIGARWLIGPVVKAIGNRVIGRPAPPFSVVLSETAGAAFGPFCFGYEAWQARRRGAGTGH